MTADLTHSDSSDFDELRHLGFNSVPMLILYPQTGPPVGFDGGTPESNVVATVELIGR
ncbi:thiol-disulfide interchange protein dsbD [Rhodopirellula europaea SH398]|uniref:Thiol-disulfide interchange protein dsbD n=1 Tax=Rhodopirellula europaea SH398 TaxID=1263868 RepID=M5S0X5_9BACT|nr:thiol-disulfide interchange protein dsbD [Rhodopirellula europaea SH398]